MASDAYYMYCAIRRPVFIFAEILGLGRIYVERGKGNLQDVAMMNNETLTSIMAGADPTTEGERR